MLTGISKYTPTINAQSPQKNYRAATRGVIIKLLRDANVNVSESQERYFMNSTDLNIAGDLANLGVLPQDSKPFINDLFTQALENRDFAAFHLLSLRPDFILQDSEGNNFLHVVCNQSLKSENWLTNAIANIFGVAKVIPMYLLFEKNALGQTPLNIAKQRYPNIVETLQQTITPKVYSGHAIEQTLRGLLLKNETGNDHATEILQCFKTAAQSNEKNALLELARLQIESGVHSDEVRSNIQTLLHRASDAGLAEADYLLGKHIYNNDPVKRWQTFERAGAKNHAGALHELAKLLISTSTRTDTLTLALSFAKRSARQGLPDAKRIARDLTNELENRDRKARLQSTATSRFRPDY